MSAKVTLRLPEFLLERLRAKSLSEGRSINDTAVQVLSSGLGEPLREDGWQSLGDLVALPPEHAYDPVAFAKLRERIGVPLDGFMEALDWVRGDA